ncbi:MAG: cyclic nucleotide-binding domain-containing protein [Ectothiorhodospiraceae bacterium]|nr:cyclic nucleotide-binding domain-containing protein [Ectothiorhodospiraceae bacterium]
MRKALFILGDLSDSDLDWLSQVGRRVSHVAGDHLIRAREPVSDIFILLEGRLTVQDASGRQVVASLYPGEIVGELSFLDSRPPNASVVAAERVVALAISRELLRARLESDSKFAAHFYRALGVFLASRLRQTMGRLGFGAGDALEDDESVDELDPELLDQTALAGRRFERLLARFRSG